MRIRFRSKRRGWFRRTFERIRRWYWHLVPYDWRPSSIWYQIKCWAWHRYTTVKPRYLGHTFIDRCGLLPHIMFEVLSDFVENECSPGCVEWYGEYAHKITVDGKEKFVRDELQELYDWWHKTYNKEYPQREGELLNASHECRPITHDIPVDYDGNVVAEEDAELFEWKNEFSSRRHQEKYKAAIRAYTEFEKFKEQILMEMMHRLVNVVPYMWT